MFLTLSTTLSAQEVQPDQGFQINPLVLESPVEGRLDLEEINTAILQQFVLIFSGYEYFPTAEDIGRLTPEPVGYLLTIIYSNAPEILPVHQHRAITALGYFPTDVSRNHLLYLLESAETPNLMRHHSITALATGFGDDALGYLEQSLSDTDVQIRLTAISAIGRIDTEASRQQLLEAYATEPHELVKGRLQEQLIDTQGVELR
jgi:hypothetical protein